MVKVRILGKETHGKFVLFLRKVLIFNKEQAGDRIRIMTYFFDVDNPYKPQINYDGLDNIESNLLFNFMNDSIRLEA